MSTSSVSLKERVVKIVGALFVLAVIFALSINAISISRQKK